MPWNWVIVGKTFHCFRDAVSRQLEASLHEPSEPTDFHDAELMEATIRINEILKRVTDNNKDPNRKLSFIVFQDQPLLVWAEYGAVSPYDEEERVARALRLSPL